MPSDQPVLAPTECPSCKGAGWLRRERPDLRPSELVLCHCQHEAAKTRHLERLMATSCLRRSMAWLTFDAFTPYQPDLSEALATCQAFADDPDGWLYLHGGYGVGKSHLLAATAMRLIERRVGALYVVVPEFLDRIRRSFNADADEEFDALWRRIESCEVLLLDDLGAEKASPWVTERLYTLIDSRYRDGSPLVVASNLSPEQIGGRIGSRLGDMRLTTVIGLEARDYRRGATA